MRSTVTAPYLAAPYLANGTLVARRLDSETRRDMAWLAWNERRRQCGALVARKAANAGGTARHLRRALSERRAAARLKLQRDKVVRFRRAFALMERQHRRLQRRVRFRHALMLTQMLLPGFH